MIIFTFDVVVTAGFVVVNSVIKGVVVGLYVVSCVVTGKVVVLFSGRFSVVLTGGGSMQHFMDCGHCTFSRTS